MERAHFSLPMLALIGAASLVAVLPTRAQDKDTAAQDKDTAQEQPAQGKAAQDQPPDKPAENKPADNKPPALPPPYKVVEGFYVDPVTMNGFRAWRAAACDRCHGAYQQGLVGPSLLLSLKTLSKEEFVKTVTEGRLDKGMPSFKTSKTIMENLDGLYQYLKGRAEGDITQYRVRELKEKEHG